MSEELKEKLKDEVINVTIFMVLDILEKNMKPELKEAELHALKSHMVDRGLGLFESYAKEREVESRLDELEQFDKLMDHQHYEDVMEVRTDNLRELLKSLESQKKEESA